MAERTTAAKTFSAEEKAAMRERAREGRTRKLDGESEVQAKIADMKEPDRAMAERIHSIITNAAPELAPTTWYGLPAYAKGSTMIVFFQPAQKFKTRYATLGFSDKAKLDDGGIWPNAYAVNELTPAVEKEIAALVKKAAS